MPSPARTDDRHPLEGEPFHQLMKDQSLLSMVGGFNRFRRPSVPEEVRHDQVIPFRELKQRLPDPPALPVVASVKQNEALSLPGFRVPHRVLADADLLFEGGNHQWSPFSRTHIKCFEYGVDEQSITLINEKEGRIGRTE